MTISTTACVDLCIWSTGNFYHLTTNRLDINICPCGATSLQQVPSFVGSGYYCESGCPGIFEHSTIYSDDVLWDGEQCGVLETECCTIFNQAWFHKVLDKSSIDSIEIRMYINQHTSDENILVPHCMTYIWNRCTCRHTYISVNKLMVNKFCLNIVASLPDKGRVEYTRNFVVKLFVSNLYPKFQICSQRCFQPLGYKVETSLSCIPVIILWLYILADLKFYTNWGCVIEQNLASVNLMVW